MSNTTQRELYKWFYKLQIKVNNAIDFSDTEVNMLATVFNLIADSFTKDNKKMREALPEFFKLLLSFAENWSMHVEFFPDYSETIVSPLAVYDLRSVYAHEAGIIYLETFIELYENFTKSV